MTTVRIKEKCCCGAEFSVEDTATFGNSAMDRYKDFLEAHTICRDADALRNKFTRTYKDDK
jgi:hypothetical protein